MLNVILTIHLLACTAMVGVIMLQRSEGGVQGLSGGGTGGIISGRGAASVLVRATMICALIFFCTSLLMTRLNADENQRPDDYNKELQKINSGANILGTTPTPSPTATVAPTPTGPDPLAAVTPSPTGLLTGGPSILTAPTTTTPTTPASPSASPAAPASSAPRPTAGASTAASPASPSPTGTPQ